MVICAQNSRGMGRAGHRLASGSAIKVYSDGAGLPVSPSDLHSAYTTEHAHTHRGTERERNIHVMLRHGIMSLVAIWIYDPMP